MDLTDLFSVAGKVALVTGGSRGIGLMIARAYVANGVRTYISSRRAEACDAAAAELSALGTCIPLPADMSTPEGIDHLAGEIAAREPALHILVNNAGTNWGAPLDRFPEHGWDKVMDLNTKSVFFLTQRLLPHLRAAAGDDDPARVINIGSVNGLAVPRLDTFSYPVSKAALHHLTRVLAHHLAADRITVNAVAPGAFDTKMMAGVLADRRDEIVADVPLGRIGAPEDMAGIAIFLASRAGAYLTGTVIRVDGGFLVDH